MLSGCTTAEPSDGQLDGVAGGGSQCVGPEEKASKKETDKLTCRLNAGGVSGTLG
jgi:hypothetical protein